KVLIVFVAGTVLMRSAGCVVNDLADRDIDPHVARTAQRPIAAGRVGTGEAVRLFVGLCLIALGFVEQLDTRTVLLSVPAVLLAASYPYAKRWHSLPQAHLGLAFAWGIPMAFSAVRRTIPWELCGVLVLATVLWAIAYDTFYAMADREEDRRIGVKSSALLFGRADRAVTALLQTLTLTLLLAAGLFAHRHAPYYAGLAVAAVLAAWEQWQIRARDPAGAFAAFLHSRHFGAVVFAGLALDTLWH
ncbi:MAG TPA: 4-hydroxybenzoate octaprenyltransferase, partial [Candidatus Binatia bacterium]|nr:4-hydroxybenzoate octaprenyltransferase [Candidatus Binatia bacterium]